MTPNPSQAETVEATSKVFGVQEMINIAGNTPIHSLNEKIEDYGELCDSDCQDCD